MGELTCTAKCAKTTLLVVNLVVAFVGLALLGCGIWFVSDPKSVHVLNITSSESLMGLIRGAGGIIIAVGLLVAVVGFLGCCGACRQKTGCLDCFSALLIIFVVLQIVATILVGVFHGQLTDSLQTASYNSTQHYYGRNDSSAITASWDIFQVEFHCCGARNFSDYSTSSWKEQQPSSIVVPKSCCGTTNVDELDDKDYSTCNDEAASYTSDQKPSQLHVQGCEQWLEDWLSSYWGILIGIVVFLIIIEITGIVLSCCLISNIKRGYEYV